MRKVLWLVNGVGGPCVLGSYAWGFTTQADPMRLWGSISPSVQGPYSACMPLAAVGYLVLLAHAHRRPRAQTVGAMAVLLLCSTAWMPLCFAYLDHGWPLWTVWGSLAGTALASIALLADAFRSAERDRLRLAACLGAIPFCVQTVLLDALVWPVFFP